MIGSPGSDTGRRSGTDATGVLVLASRSPQRQEILRTLGVAFRVHVAGVDEQTDGDPVAVAIENARRKAAAVASREPVGTTVLGSDTVIAVDSRAVGKPADEAEAAAMLRRWSGRSHHVVTAVAVIRTGPDGPETLLAEADATQVRFRTLSDEEIAWYVGTGEWRERAGGYAIQLRGALLVDGIDGDWWTVVGLPVALIARRLPTVLR